MKVEDLVDADGSHLQHRRARRLWRGVFDLLHRAAGDREHDDERHLALSARDLEPKTLLLGAEDLHVAALQAAPADGAVVKPRAVANELADAHRGPYYAPRLQAEFRRD